jgi:hypothetical protein
MTSGPCPRCGSGATSGGLIPGSRGGGPVCFIPQGCRKTWWWLGVRFRESPFFACLACGLVWSNLRPEELRSHVEKYGDATARSRLPAPEIKRGQKRGHNE